MKTPANKFFHVHRGGSAHAARIPGIISTRRRPLLGEREKKEREGTRLAATSLASPRSFTARCYTQFKLLSDQGANIHHSELALAVFTPGLSYKRQIKNTSFHFIPSPCIFSGLYNFFFFIQLDIPHHPPAANPATLRPITMSRERQRCRNELQSKRNYRSRSARKKKARVRRRKKKKKGHLDMNLREIHVKMGKVSKKVHFQLAVARNLLSELG